MDNLTSGLGAFLIILLIALVVFLILRSVMLWYWKIDTMVTNQEAQNKLMAEQRDLLEQIYFLQGGSKVQYPSNSKEEIEKKARLFDKSQGK